MKRSTVFLTILFAIGGLSDEASATSALVPGTDAPVHGSENKVLPLRGQAASYWAQVHLIDGIYGELSHHGVEEEWLNGVNERFFGGQQKARLVWGHAKVTAKWRGSANLCFEHPDGKLLVRLLAGDPLQGQPYGLAAFKVVDPQRNAVEEFVAGAIYGS